MSSLFSSPDFGDDWMAIADAVGITAHPELSAKHLPHPSVRREFTDLALELLLSKWGAELEDLDPDVPIPYVVTTDDGECAGGCGRIVCHCLVARCEGAVDQGACDHGWRLCDECREHCDECRANQDGDVR